MGSGERLSEECERLLEAFGYHRNKSAQTWVNKDARRAISEDTVRAWEPDQLRIWLTKNAAPT
jgi:hypothetical protein